MNKKDYNQRLQETYKIVGLNLVRLRGERTQEELALKAAINRNTIISLEAGNSFHFKTLVKLAEVLNVPIADFFISDTDREEISNKAIKLMAYIDAINIEERQRELIIKTVEDCFLLQRAK